MTLKIAIFVHVLSQQDMEIHILVVDDDSVVDMIALEYISIIHLCAVGDIIAASRTVMLLE